jgi:hypothetical protein
LIKLRTKTKFGICVAAIILLALLLGALSYIAISNEHNTPSMQNDTRPDNKTTQPEPPKPEPKPEPSYKDTTDKLFVDNNVTIIEVTDYSRHTGFSSGLAQVRVEPEGLVALCESKGVKYVFFHEGRMFNEGLLRHYWYWFFIEDTTIYYVKYQYYYGW